MQCTRAKVAVKVKVDVGWAAGRAAQRRQYVVLEQGAGRAARCRAQGAGTPAAGGRGRRAGRPLQIHFRPAATARHASERKLVAASERVASRAGPRHALRTSYARAGELSCPWTSHARAPINKAICPYKGTVLPILVHDKQCVKTLYSSFKLNISI